LTEQKYYFISYSEHAPFQEHIENLVSDIHPIDFAMKYKGIRILFYAEITKEQYDKYDR
jgi:hypothetical protein